MVFGVAPQLAKIQGFDTLEIRTSASLIGRLREHGEIVYLALVKDKSSALAQSACCEG
jgi:hypothetical protein